MSIIFLKRTNSSGRLFAGAGGAGAAPVRAGGGAGADAGAAGAAAGAGADADALEPPPRGTPATGVESLKPPPLKVLTDPLVEPLLPAPAPALFALRRREEGRLVPPPPSVFGAPVPVPTTSGACPISPAMARSISKNACMEM